MKGHPREGQETFFHEKILASKGVCSTTDVLNAYREGEGMYGWSFKKHTLRLNYELWAARAEEINRGEAVLSLRQWSGKPYRSKQ